MSVPQNKRRISELEVFRQLNFMRRDVTDLLFRNFSFNKERALVRMQKGFGNKTTEEMSDEELTRYYNYQQKLEDFDGWFIPNERETIIDLMRKVAAEVRIANSFYVLTQDEADERRLHQDLAIGYCSALIDEMQYVAEVLPVDVNKFCAAAKDVQDVMNLVKRWRKSDNKRRKMQQQQKEDGEENEKEKKKSE